MSLGIRVKVRDPQTGEWNIVEMPTGYHLMGWEVYRRELWGTEIMKEIGLEVLPSLGEGAYLTFETPEEITELEQEAKLIQDNLDVIGQSLGEWFADRLANLYLRNLFNAIALARSLNGKISIG